MRKRGVRTLHRARPEPGDDREFLAHERLEVGPLTGHLGVDFDGRIEMADALLGLLRASRAP